MGKHRMIDPKEYEHLELVFNILKYPSLKNTVRRLNIAASHCQKVLTPTETSLTQLLQDVKNHTNAYIDGLGQTINEKTYFATEDIVASEKTIPLRHKYDKMTREDLFGELFHQIDVMKGKIIEDMGYLREPSDITNPSQISINAAEYISRYQELFATMNDLYDYFEPTAEDSNHTR